MSFSKTKELGFVISVDTVTVKDEGAVPYIKIPGTVRPKLNETTVSKIREEIYELHGVEDTVELYDEIGTGRAARVNVTESEVDVWT